MILFFRCAKGSKVIFRKNSACPTFCITTYKFRKQEKQLKEKGGRKWKSGSIDKLFILSKMGEILKTAK